MSDFFDCPGCIFMAAVERETVERGRAELSGVGHDDKKEEAYFEKIFKMAFSVPKNSFDVQKYIADNLGRVNLRTDDEAEIRHYGELARLSVGSDPKALERLLNSLLLLKSLAGEEVFGSATRRLTLFALLCMQSRFPEVYRCLVQGKDQITPEFLTSLPQGSVLEEMAGLGEAEKRSFRIFAREFCSAIDTDGQELLTEQDCAAFVETLAVSAITSLK